MVQLDFSMCSAAQGKDSCWNCCGESHARSCDCPAQVASQLERLSEELETAAHPALDALTATVSHLDAVCTHVISRSAVPQIDCLRAYLYRAT